MIRLREYTKKDLPELRKIWNQVVEEGISFPQLDKLSEKEAERFFAEQTCTGVAEDGGEVVGLYILHPNNVGRCGHIANASYAVAEGQRGKKIGEKLVKHSLMTAKKHSFRIMQFNAVLAENVAANRLYERIGFVKVGLIPEGFLLPDGTYTDIFVYYIPLESLSFDEA